MGTILDRNAAADWGVDVVVPDPLEGVRAFLLPGGVRPALQSLLSRSWSLLRGTSYHGRLFVNPASPGVNLAAPEKDANGDPEALVVYPRDIASPRSLRYGNLDFRVVNGAKATRVTADGTYGTNWAHDPSICTLAGADGIATLTQFGLAWTNIAAVGSLGNPGQAQNLRNELRPVNTTKHWGTVATNGQGGIDLSQTDGAGGWNAAVFGNSQQVELTWPTAFANTNYCLTLTPVIDPNVGLVLPIEIRTLRTTTKAVVRFTTGAAPVNPFSSVVFFNFTVHGRLAS